MWNVKQDTNEHVHETDSQTQGTDLWLPRGTGLGVGVDWESGISRCKLLYVEWIKNKVLLYTTEDYIQYPAINHKYEKECM